MLIDFFYTLRDAKLPVSVGEYLTLLDALKVGVGEPDAMPSLETLHTLSRLVLVKDEAHFDKFDRAFSAYFGTAPGDGSPLRAVPAEWLRKRLERTLSAEDRARLQALGWDALMDALRERLATQQHRHEGGSRMIGTGGTSPFGAYGEHPEGIRIGQDHSRHRQAVKVWDERAFRDYDDTAALGTRGLQIALRRLRRFAREGVDEELDLDGTLRATAANAGHLELEFVPERRNKVRVLLLMDVGGSMDEHVSRVQALFTAARSEFRQLDFYYFHNCVYDTVWKHNERRRSERIDTFDLIRKHHRDHKLIFVGDATMSPYEILQPGGSVEHHNTEAGATWLRRLAHAFPAHAWINPEPTGLWPYRQSIALVQQLLDQRMYPLTLAGLDAATRTLSA